MNELKAYIESLEELFLTLSAGKSTHYFIKNVLNRDELPIFLNKSFHILLENPDFELCKLGNSCLSKEYFRLIQSGLHGEPIMNELTILLDSFRQSLISEYEKRLNALPIYMSLFLLFFIFPAYMVLLTGPILQKLFSF